MTFLVPFDGSELAEAALIRATEFNAVLDERALAVTVIPEGDVDYAREMGWLGPNEEFDMERIVTDLHRQVTDLAPSADFRHEVVDRYASRGIIAKRLRTIATNVGASVVAIGSENAGRLVTSISSVGGGVATNGSYDVMIVRDRSPAKIEKLEERSPYSNPKSDFYIPE